MLAKYFPGIKEKLADHLSRRIGEDLTRCWRSDTPFPLDRLLRSKVLARGGGGFAGMGPSCGGIPVASRLTDTVLRSSWPRRWPPSTKGNTITRPEENFYRLQELTNWETDDRIARSIGIGLEDEKAHGRRC